MLLVRKDNQSLLTLYYQAPIFKGLTNIFDKFYGYR